MKTDSLFTKASDLYNNKQYKEAINTYLSINPATADSMIGVATSYQELGDRDNAIAYYQKPLN